MQKRLAVAAAFRGHCVRCLVDKENFPMNNVFKLLLATVIVGAPLLDASPALANGGGWGGGYRGYRGGWGAGYGAFNCGLPIVNRFVRVMPPPVILPRPVFVTPPPVVVTPPPVIRYVTPPPVITYRQIIVTTPQYEEVVMVGGKYTDDTQVDIVKGSDDTQYDSDDTQYDSDDTQYTDKGDTDKDSDDDDDDDVDDDRYSGQN
jgi:hypothetical protein